MTSFKPIYQNLPKAPPPNTITLGLVPQHVDLQETCLVHNKENKPILFIPQFRICHLLERNINFPSHIYALIYDVFNVYVYRILTNGTDEMVLICKAEKETHTFYKDFQ